MLKVNAVGMACPLPVIETRKALRTEDVVETTVDNKIATTNEIVSSQLAWPKIGLNIARVLMITWNSNAASKIKIHWSFMASMKMSKMDVASF